MEMRKSVERIAAKDTKCCSEIHPNSISVEIIKFNLNLSLPAAALFHQ